MKIDEVLTYFRNVKQTGSGQWIAACPAHDDKTPSLSISEGEDGKTLLHCHAGCDKATVLKAVNLKASDLFPYTREEAARIVAVYPYTDETGKLLFEVCKREPKSFFQRKPSGNGGWDYRLGDVRRVLYHLPQLLNADKDAVVFIIEGEKDCDKLVELGLVATCNPGGAGQWRENYNEYLRGRHVAIIPDCDEVGRSHAANVAKALQDTAESIKIIELPDLPPSGDVSDFLDGHTIDELCALAEEAPAWGPERLGNQEPIAASLENARNAVRDWLELPDLDVVDLILATVVANGQPGDPVWMLLVGAPSSAKSELLRALGNASQVYRISSLTGKTLISGHKDANGGLLFRIGKASTLLLLDFGQILSLHPNDKAVVLQRLREVYDGYTKADFGNRVDGLEWEGKLGFLAGVTPAIEKYTSVGAELGDRFLLYSLDVPDPSAQARGAMKHSGQEATMRRDLSQAFLEALQSVPDPDAVTIGEEALEVLTSLAILTTRLRSAVSRNRYTRVIDYLPKPEGPARFAKALVCLGKALATLHGKIELGQDELRILAKVSLDCIPSRRKAVVGGLLQKEDCKTKEIGLAANVASISTGDILEDLMYLGAVERWTEGKSDNAPFRWRLKPEIADQWRLANDIAKGNKAPLKKPTREIREILKGSTDEDTHSLVFQEELAGVPS